MNLKPILVSSLLAATVAVSASVQAASEANTQAVAQAPVTGAQDNEVVKRHSHVEGKTGVRQTTSEAKDRTSDPSKDKNRHLHPRDGK